MKNVERARKAGQSSKKHGAYAFENRGEAALAPSEVASLQELRDLVSSESGRQEVREEICARLVIIARKVFFDMEKQMGNPKWWDAGVVKRGATWIAELRRWLETFHPELETSRNVTEALEVLTVERENEPKS
jgi:hypothetical protein